MEGFKYSVKWEDFFDVRNPMENEGPGIKNMIIYEHEKKRQAGQKAPLTI